MADRRRTRSGARRRRHITAKALRTAAERRLARFRRGSALAVGLTGVMILAVGLPEAGGAAQVADTTEGAGQAVQEATGALRELASSASAFLPKLAIAIGVLIVAGLFLMLLRPLLQRAFGSWGRGTAASAGFGILVWIIAISAALAVLTGDARTLLGSVGLLGLALSWALQAPIESFTAWVLNSFKEYYRVGDRIAVGDVFGDVHRIDFLTTTVWEIGRPDANRLGGGPTGGLITFPNSEILRGNLVNYTRDFAWVWDELTVGVANESDLRYAMDLARAVADRIVGAAMKEPSATYRTLLERARLDADIAESPQVYLSAADAWMNVSVRYLVPARRRRSAASDLLLALSEEFARGDHGGRIISAYPFTRVEVVDGRDEGRSGA